MAYDVVLLDHEVQGGRGLEWIADFRSRPAFPPIVYFAAGRSIRNVSTPCGTKPLSIVLKFQAVRANNEI